MNHRLALLFATVLFASSACTSESQPISKTEPTGGGGSGGGGVGGGGTGCPPGTTTEDDGSCTPAGVPADACGEGFEAIDGGCVTIMPDEPCGEGLIAVPGDTTCREIAPCGQGTWGNIPTEANTQFVDGAYLGTDNDGTETRPWSTVQAGIDAAEEDAVVAIAAGSYAEPLFVTAYAVRLMGRCPTMVEIAIDNGVDGGVFIGGAASGAEVRGVAITSPGMGVYVHGAADVVLEDLWLHDIGFWGLHVDSTASLGSVTIRNVLVERARSGGIVSLGAEAIVERVAVRDTRADLGSAASGVTAQDIWDGHRASMTVRQSFITASLGVGAYVGGADLIFERTAIIDSHVSLGAQVSGMGILQQDAPGHPASTLTLRQTVVEQSRYVGVYISGGMATLENSTIRDVTPHNKVGAGHGVGIEGHVDTGMPSTVEMRHCLVERATETGVSVYGSDLTMAATWVRATAMNEKNLFGRGVSVQNGSVDSTRRSAVHVDDSRIEESHEAGMVVRRSDLWLDHSAVTDTYPLPTKGLGDGVIVFGHGSGSSGAETNAEITNSLIARSARVGIAVFGGNLTLGGNTIQCNPIAIGAEVYQNSEPILVDDGGNACACDGVETSCRAQQSSLTPPEVL